MLILLMHVIMPIYYIAGEGSKNFLFLYLHMNELLSIIALKFNPLKCQLSLQL